MKKLYMPLLLMAMTTLAHATESSGVPAAVRTQDSPSAPGHIRVSIKMAYRPYSGPAPTPCGFNSEWYAFELPNNNPTAELWQQILTARFSYGNFVKVVGTGLCDAYGIEKVAYIDYLANRLD